MAIRVGIDLVAAVDVRESIELHGDRYLRRIYSEAEVSDCTRASDVDTERLAARFAAKEAAFKVLGTERDAISWRDVEVGRSRSGRVELALSERAAAIARTGGITDLALSLTHDHGYAAAVVVAEISRAQGES